MPSRKRRAVKRLMEAVVRTHKQRALTRIARVCERKLAKSFAAQGRAVVRALGTIKARWPISEALHEAEDDYLNEAESLIDQALRNSQELLLNPLTLAIQDGMTAGAEALLAQIAFDLSFRLQNPRAVAYIARNGAQLVKRIDETTRADMRKILETGIQNGWSYDRVAKAIQLQFARYGDGESWWNWDAPRPQAHIDSRAHLIAVTEAGNAYEAGNAIVADDLADAGLEMEKYWSTMGDSRVSEGCRENEAEGWIPSARPHKSGHMHPLRFPGCRCDELYRLKGEEE